MANGHSGMERNERRENFRVADEALLSFVVVTAGQAEQRRLALRAAALPHAFSLSSRLLELRQQSTVLRRHAQQESATFARLFDQLDHKIDLLGEVLMLQALGGREASTYTLDLGAEGMGLTLAKPYTPGTWLDMSLVFRSTGVGLRTFAEVLRCEAAGLAHRVGLKFWFVHDFDSELLVYQVLTRQSQILRDRNNLDSPD